MKTTRKILALVLAMAMIMAMATTVFAAGSIKVEGTSENEYTVYKFLNIIDDPDGSGKVYTLATGWEGFLDHPGVSSYLQKVGNYISWKHGTSSDADAAALASLAKAYIAAESISSDVKIYAAADGTEDKPNTAAGLDDGYYVLVSNAGHSGIVSVIGDEVSTVTDKNPDGGDVGGDDEGLPAVLKRVQEDSNNAWGKENNADIGETINFKTTISTDASAYNYVLHDNMVSQLTFIEVTGVILTKAEDSSETALVKDTDYFVNATGITCSQNCDFHISFSEAIENSLQKNDKIDVSYTAYINDDADCEDGYVNDTWLTHTDINIETKHDSTTSRSYKLTITKKDDQKVVLAGAGFVLKNADGKFYKYAAASEGADKKVSWVDSVADATEIISGADGLVVFMGIDALPSDGQYVVVEKTVPSGYVKAADQKVTVNTSTGIDIINTKGTALPETGGIGTTIFYTIGGFMVLAAVVLLITKKRMAVK